jgi:hypothetical protein
MDTFSMSPDDRRNRRPGRRIKSIVEGPLLVVLLPVAAFLAFLAVQALNAVGSGAAGGCGGG